MAGEPAGAGRVLVRHRACASADLAMSHEVVNFDVPTGSNWNEQFAGSAVTDHRRSRVASLQRRVGEVGDAP